ncbi:UNVERIFIED_CONTAM: hypothetical protein Sangu_3251200 [Sesamum angustifolium]|uniref:Uncharacterized protein n=1 Tax=Sesamum angustifolium TaxID=2727405 RepID=A0AAW2JFM5_9LAMI
MAPGPRATSSPRSPGHALHWKRWDNFYNPRTVPALEDQTRPSPSARVTRSLMAYNLFRSSALRDQGGRMAASTMPPGFNPLSRVPRLYRCRILEGLAPASMP